LNVGQDSLRLAVIDITARRKAEEILILQKAELQAAYKDMEDLSATVSHDLRAPLRTICSFSEIVLADYADKLDDTGKELLNRIMEASQTMSQLTVDILKLIYFSQAEILRENVDLSKMVKSITDDLKASQPDRQVEFIIAPNQNVNADKNLLGIGIRNILENAWKFSSKRTKTRIEFGMTNQNSAKVYFIRDNGVGFDMQYINELFKPFHRLHTNEDFPGYGIGLATVQRVIRRHGGKIWADSELGKGTTFYFTLGDYEAQ
jgi:light-regulated signal transduction histidine kinase (bacteriophytochrome)